MRLARDGRFHGGRTDKVEYVGLYRNGLNLKKKMSLYRRKQLAGFRVHLLRGDEKTSES